MTRRERIRSTLNHQETEKLPVDFGSRSSAIEIETYNRLRNYLGIEEELGCFLRAHAEMHDEALDFLQVDTRWIRAIPEESWIRDKNAWTYLDAWKVPWKKLDDSYYYELGGSPLSGLKTDELVKQRWDILPEELLQSIENRTKRLFEETEAALFCDQIGAGIFERAWYMRGFEQFLLELVAEPELTMAYLENITVTQIQAYESLLSRIGRYIEGVIITDDVASQEALLISPELYRKMIKPLQQQLIESIQSFGLKVIHHCCGAIREIIPDFIEMGIEIIHPVQSTARGMDAGELNREFGKDLVFWGGGCDTDLLQHGSPEEVSEHVHRNIDIFTPGGGFVFTTTHCIQPETPLENMIAMRNTYTENED